MANRGLSDEEIALIKGMLAIKMAAQDICGYMFRPGRSLNPAGVYEIKSGKRAREIPAKSEDDVKDYIKNHPYFGSIAVADRISELRKQVRGMLRLQKDIARCFVEPKETGRLEFKETFHLLSLPHYARSLIGYANHSGGFILFGIKDDQTVIGLKKNDAFRKLDPERFTGFLKDTVQPNIIWGRFQFTFNELEIGCLYAEESDCKPHITTRNADSIKANQIYYRYEGQTSVIRPGELFNIVRQRESEAIQHAIAKLQQIVGVGVSDAQILYGGADGNITTDDRVFIEKEVIRTRTLTDRDVLLDFINGSMRAGASDYIELAAHEAVRWLPLYFFMKEGDLNITAVLELLKQSKTAKPGASDHIKKRLAGTETAFREYIGEGARNILEELKKGNIPKEGGLTKSRHLSECLIGVEELDDFDGPFLRAILSQIISDYERHEKDSAIGSNMRRSAARVDELLYGSEFHH
ncbi:MAG: ATP-binding protein [Sphingomonadaceae bacterium]|nr:ATP-binding protein [Sphingomonadaceae bacterium]